VLHIYIYDISRLRVKVDKSTVWSNVGRLSRTVITLQGSHSRSRWWPRGLKRGSATIRLLVSAGSDPTGAWISLA